MRVKAIWSLQKGLVDRGMLTSRPHPSYFGRLFYLLCVPILWCDAGVRTVLQRVYSSVCSKLSVLGVLCEYDIPIDGVFCDNRTSHSQYHVVRSLWCGREDCRTA